MNRRYGTWKRADEFSKSIESLPFFSRYRPVFRTLSEPTLRELHEKLRGQKCEDNFWDAVLMVLDHALPDDMAFDLIERKVALGWLEHSPQSDAVFWHLMAEHSDANLTLAQRLYTDSNHDLKDFERMLSQSPVREWVLEFVAQWSASSIEKRRVFEKAIKNHPERKKLLSLNTSIKQELFVFWDYFSHTERIEALYANYDFDKMLSIARNDQTPDEILHELEDLHDFPNAAKVRATARHTLRRREEVER